MGIVDRAMHRIGEDAATVGAILSVDLGAIAANYRSLATLAGSAACAAVVKADAYGLGADRVAPVLAAAGCRQFFVAQVSEGVALRAILGPGRGIAVLNGATPGSEAACHAHGLVPVLNDRGQAEAWRALARRLGITLPGILQADSGMARFGFAPADLTALLDDPAGLEGITPTLLMSHLACADEPEHPANARQLAVFDSLRARLPGVRASLAASSGTFLGAAFRADMVRPGAALYGLAPQAGRPNPMRPVVRLQARVMQVRTVPAGTPVGYSHTESTTRESRLATVALGYADGYPRATAKGEAWLAEHRLPVIGRVSMDSLILDATDLPPDTLRPGMLVDVIGPNRSVDAVAASAGTIGYEILTGLGHRFHRLYSGA